MGKDVYQTFIKAGYSGHVKMHADKKEKAFLDLWGVNVQQVMAMGVKKEHIEVSEICTFQNRSYFSARRDGFETGRFGVGIMLQP